MRQISKRIWNPDQTEDARYQALHEGGGETGPDAGATGGSSFSVTADQLADLTHMDGRAKDKTGAIESSKKLITDFGSLEGLATMLQTDLKTGINAATHAERQRVFGPNSFAPPKLRTVCELILENFEDFINRVLLVAALVSVVIGEIQHPFTAKGLLEGVSIAVALTIIIVVTSTNNYISEKRLADLVALSDKQEVPVFRGSDVPAAMDTAELVVGDVIALKMGDKVPADCLVIEGKDMSCIEGDLTGEPDALDKARVTPDNCNDGLTNCVMFCKALVQTGNCTALVVTVGEMTAAGQIEKLLREKKKKRKEQPEEGEEGKEGEDGDEEEEEEESNQTHLQKKLATIADKIGQVGYAVAGLTLAGQMVRLALEYDQNFVKCGCMNITSCEPMDDPGMCEELSLQGGRIWTDLLAVVIVAITVVVVAIPEGLPLAVTISLSFSSAKMRALQNLVRTLAKVEVMGGATHICSDKTGTLTQNSMTVMAVSTLGQLHMVESGGTVEMLRATTQAVRAASSVKTCGPDGTTVWDALLEQITWNTDVFVDADDTPGAASTRKLVGNVTEKGLLGFFRHEIDYVGIEKSQALLKDGRRLTDVAFSSSRKRASMIVRRADRAGEADEVRVYTKGAPDVLFDYCTHVLNEEGVVEPKDAETGACPEAIRAVPGFDTLADGGTTSHIEVLARTVKYFASKAYRTILVAYRDMSMEDYQKLEADHNNFAKEADREAAFENNLTAYGLFGLQDPLRPQIVDSINQCRASGIRVIMCTGDNIDTASAISLEAGILSKPIDPQAAAAAAKGEKPTSYAAMVGKQFRAEVGSVVTDPKTKKKREEVNVAKFRRLNFKEELSVLARSAPQDKYLLVTGIQECGGVVAVTGDGTNDAPALKAADVGFAMGRTGTDVAKGASDIILLDDNFASIIVALRFGRNVYDNVRKFLQFQLTVNVVAMFIVFFGSVILKDSPLTAVQMLWVNMIMDTFAALALATEPPDEDILDRPPYQKDAAIVTEAMWRNVHGHAIYQIIVICVVIFAGQGMLCDHNYDRECSQWTGYDPATGEGGYDENGQPIRWCQKFNPFYSLTHYYEGGTKAYWDGRVVDCEAQGPYKAPLAYADGTATGLTAEDQTKATEKCVAEQGLLKRQNDRAAWIRNPAAKFDVKELTKFNCLLAEARWPTPYDEFFPQNNDGAECDALLDQYDDMADEDVRFDALRAQMGAFINSLPADEPYWEVYPDDGYGLELNAWRLSYADEGVILFPWDQKAGSYTQKALHFTYVFQIFVFMQIFNQINARKLKEDERNVFSGMLKNPWFNVITFITFIVQMLMVEVGGEVMKVHELTLAQNGWCLLIGAGELIWGLFLKFLPTKWFGCIQIGDAPMTDEEKAKSFVSSLKPSMTGKKQKEKDGKKGSGAKAKGSKDAFTKAPPSN